MSGKTTRKAPGAVGCKHASDRHSARTRRWAKQKNEEDIDKVVQIRECVTTIGGRKRAKWQFRRLHRLQGEARKKEREVLATTSLDKLIH